MNDADKETLLKRWFTDEELADLDDMRNKRESVKIKPSFTNLYFQASHTMQSIARLKEEILENIKNINTEIGPALADMLVQSIYDSFITTFRPFDNTEEVEVTYTREDLMAFANVTLEKINASQIIRNIFENMDRINRNKQLMELTKNGVLI